MAQQLNEIDFMKALDSNSGFCAACGSIIESGVEPDARNYLCPHCGAKEVFGAEEAVISGALIIN